MTRHLCAWCGHPPHDRGCNARISVGKGRAQHTTDCPCNHQRKDKP